jgi:hypothetical protein
VKIRDRVRETRELSPRHVVVAPKELARQMGFETPLQPVLRKGIVQFWVPSPTSPWWRSAENRVELDQMRLWLADELRRSHPFRELEKALRKLAA